MKRREIENETRKNYIIEAAEKLFLKKGYYLTTMDEIAKKSEFSKPTVYKYFISKEDIACHVHLKLLTGRIDFFLKAIAGITDPYEKLFAFGIVYYEYADQHRNQFKFQLTLDTLIQEETKLLEVTDKILKLNENIGNIIKRSMTELTRNKKPFAEFDLHNTMVSFYASLRTVIAHAIFDPRRNDEMNRRSFYINFLKIFLRGLEK